MGSVYLSSTLADLSQHRQSVRAALSRYYVVNDSYSADSRSTLASCLADVRQAQVYVGIFAYRYGFIPDDPTENPHKLSITELEYQAARAANIPCLIFLLDESQPWPPNRVDNPRDRVDALRQSLAVEQRPALFKSEDELIRLVVEGTRDHFERTRRQAIAADAPSMDPEAQAAHPRQLKHASLLLFLEGTDDASAQLLGSVLQGKHALRPFGFSPEDPPSLAAVDGAFASCRTACLLLSPAALTRLATFGATLALWFELFRTQVGPCMLLLDRVRGEDLPEPLRALPRCDLGAWLALGTATLTEPLTSFLREMKRLYVDFDRQNLIGLSYFVLAMTRGEAEALKARVDAPAGAAQPLTDHLAKLSSRLAEKGVRWTDRYQAERPDFQPFEERTVVELLRNVVREINDQHVVPRRDRDNLRGNLIRLRFYPFEPRLVHDDALQQFYLQIKQRGCLVIADELSLCEPTLRAAARRFFDERSVSVVALAAGDPMLDPLELTVTQVMDVGDLLGRFRDRLDLRCELAVVSLAGLRRWLRFSIPETLGTNGLEVADPDLRARFRREAFGVIFTFYSFKGGVGRSMALANVGALFAKRGLRTLVVDFDLEAPGLERYFKIDDFSARKNLGFIDLVMAFKRSLTASSPEGPNFRDLKSFIYPVYPSLPGSGSLHLLPAGCREPEAEMRNYALNVRTFDWQDFYYNWEGEAFFEWFRKTTSTGADAFDVVLVDSRTGVTEMGGICAYRLADAVVMLCAANRQNIAGTRSVANDFKSQSVTALRRGRTLEMVVVPARIEQNDPDLLEQFYQRFDDAFRGELPEALQAVGLTFRDLAIPYELGYAFEERVLSSPDDPRPPGHIEGRFALIADALTLLAKEGRLAEQATTVRSRLSGRERLLTPTTTDAAAPISPTADVLNYDPTAKFASFDVYVCYANADAQAVEGLVFGLRQAGLSIFMSVVATSGVQGEAASTTLHHSRSFLLCAGARGLTENQKWELKLARQLERKVLPVLLPGAEHDIFSLALGGVADTAAYDLRALPERDSAFELLVQAIALAKPGPKPEVAAPTTEARFRNPYPGIVPFQEKDAAYFFGRETEGEQLLKSLQQASVVSVVGPSRVGKTSLILAGVFPRLRRTPFFDGFEVVHIDALAENAATRLREISSAARATPLFVFVDHVDDAANTADFITSFFAVLTIALLGSSRLHLLSAQRRSLARLPGLGGPLTKTIFEQAVGLPSASALRAMVQKPAEQVGDALEPGLAERVVEDLGSDPAAPWRLQLAMRPLCEQRERGWLRHDTYTSSGGVAQAYATYAEKVWKGLDEQPELQRAAAGVLLRLFAIDELGSFSSQSADVSQFDRPEQAVAIDRLIGVVTLAEDRIALGHNPGAALWERLRALWSTAPAFFGWRVLVNRRMRNHALLHGPLLTKAELAQGKKWLGTPMAVQDLTASERDFIRMSERRLRLRNTVVSVAALLLPITFGLYAQASEAASARALAERDAKNAAQAAREAKALEDAARRESALAEEALAEAKRQAAVAEEAARRALACRGVPRTGSKLRVYIQIESRDDRQQATQLGEWLRECWDVQGVEFVDRHTCGDVRAFYAADKEAASRLAEDVHSYLETKLQLDTGERPRTQATPFLPRVIDLVGKFAKARPQSLELWLPNLKQLEARPAEVANQNDDAKLQLVPAGCFVSGSVQQDIARWTQELKEPWAEIYATEHTRRNDIWVNRFYVYRNEVTNSQFAKYRAAVPCASATPCTNWVATGSDDYPATNVSVQDAEAYCAWAHTRLPTEDEWEKAARGTDGRRWPWGDTPDATRFNGSSQKLQAGNKVGSYPAGDSPYGVSDMAGNVWEYTASPWVLDVPGRLIKGGSFLNGLLEVRSSVRWASRSERVGSPFVGFRCATTDPP